PRGGLAARRQGETLRHGAPPARTTLGRAAVARIVPPLPRQSNPPVRRCVPPAAPRPLLPRPVPRQEPNPSAGKEQQVRCHGAVPPARGHRRPPPRKRPRRRAVWSPPGSR